MKKILVTGADGQLGQELQAISKDIDEYTLHFVNRSILDITDESAVFDCLAKEQYTLVINCAAYTAVDIAESDILNATRVNADGPLLLAKACRAHNAKLIHISTDFVFDGLKSSPYNEDDQVNPLGVYGKTKLQGERNIAENLEDYLIIRTSWLYSSFGKNFVKTIIRLSNDRDKLNIISDQTGTPTYAGDLAKAILEIIPKFINSSGVSGIYHYSNEGIASWYDFAKEIVNFTNISCQINPIETHQYPTPAKRPCYSVLNKRKIKEIFEMEIPYWKESLETCIKLLK